MKNQTSKGRNCGKPSRLRGFTLIELLVVVSIIALLISILLPSLKKAREQAKAAAGLANLKGIGTSSVTYSTDDASESSIPVHPIVLDNNRDQRERLTTARAAFGGKSGNGRFDGNTLYWGTGNFKGPATRPMNGILFKNGLTDFTPPPFGTYTGGDILARWADDEKLNLNIFKCPSDTGYKGLNYTDLKESGKSSFDFFGNSYWANALWTTSGGPCFSNSPFLRPYSRIPNPANTLYFWEQAGAFAWDANPPESCGDKTDTVVVGWHKRPWMFNAVFADGHGSMVKMDSWRAPQLSSYPNAPGGSNPYFWYHCVIIRGSDWQMDTLPSPEVPTNIDCG